MEAKKKCSVDLFNAAKKCSVDLFNAAKGNVKKKKKHYLGNRRRAVWALTWIPNDRRARLKSALIVVKSRYYYTLNELGIVQRRQQSLYMSVQCVVVLLL